MVTRLTFEELSLSPEIQQSIHALGFRETSPIQAAAIPVIMEGRDIIGQAQTGTGKTAAFAIPVIERLGQRQAPPAAKKQAQVLVLCPTRELAMQVAEEFRKLLKHQPALSVVSIYGGESITHQFRALAKNPQIIVSTPGRLLDHFRRGSIRLNHIHTVVLDEADEMLNMGFRQDIETILNSTPRTRQTILFSATMSKPIQELASRYQQNPQHVKVVQPSQEEVQIEQLYVEVQNRKKLNTLIYLIEFHQLKLALVFCNTKHQVDDLVVLLRNQGYSADGLHGGLTQPKRDKVMNGFRKGLIKFLVATDVASRGIDVRNIEAVFNYDLPQDIEHYIHRIGRTGRAGKSGRAFTFVQRGELHQLRKIRQTFNSTLSKHEIPALA
jgi:ATP-dependent RNA helicase DeaD